MKKLKELWLSIKAAFTKTEPEDVTEEHFDHEKIMSRNDPVFRDFMKQITDPPEEEEA